MTISIWKKLNFYILLSQKKMTTARHLLERCRAIIKKCRAVFSSNRNSSSSPPLFSFSWWCLPRNNICFKFWIYKLGFPGHITVFQSLSNKCVTWTFGELVKLFWNFCDVSQQLERRQIRHYVGQNFRRKSLKNKKLQNPIAV